MKGFSAKITSKEGIIFLDVYIEPENREAQQMFKDFLFKDKLVIIDGREHNGKKYLHLRYEIPYENDTTQRFILKYILNFLSGGDEQ